MNSPYRQLKQHLGLVSAICGSLVISSLPAIAQTRPNPSTMNQADLERICTDYRATRDDGTSRAQLNRIPASDASSDVVRDRTTASSTGTPTSGDRPASSTTNRVGSSDRTTSSRMNRTGSSDRTASSTMNRTGSSDRTASSTMNRTGSSDRISAENFSREELDRMCANFQPSENRNTPSNQSDDTPGDNMNQQSVPPARTAPENQPSRTNQPR